MHSYWPTAAALPALAGTVLAFLAFLPVPACGQAEGAPGREHGRAAAWAQTSLAKPGSEDELSLLQSTHTVAPGLQREAASRAGANASSADAPAPGALGDPRNHSAAAGIQRKPHLHRSLMEASLTPQSGLPSSVSLAWVQDTFKDTVTVAQKMVFGMSALEFIMLIAGIVLVMAGALYFLIAFTFGDQEDFPISKSARPSPARSPLRSAANTPEATQTLATTQKYSLAIPSVYDAPHDHSKKTDYEIKDSMGKKLLNVEVMRPFQDDDADIGAPHEYVSLHSKDGEEELAMCALGPTGDGNWDCNVYQGETDLYGSLVTESGSMRQNNMQFALVSPKGERLLVLRGRPQDRRMEVLDHNGSTAAVIEPGKLSFGRPGEFYQAECVMDADVGLIVLSLLAVDRLLSHKTRDRKSVV